MHIGIVGYGLHPPWTEGMKVTTINLIKALRAYTASEVSVISSYKGNQRLLTYVEYAQSSKNKSFASSLLLHIRMFFLMHKLNKSKKIDLFLLGFTSHSIFSFFSKSILKKPTIALFFGGIRHKKILTLLNTPNRIDAYITTSRDDLRSFPFNPPIHQINPSIDSNIFVPRDKDVARNYFNLPKHDFICAYFGNLHEKRLPSELLHRIKELAKERGGFTFLVITQTRDQKLSSRIIMSLGTDVIIKIRTLSEDDKVLAYNAADVLIFPFDKSVLYHENGVVIDPPLTILEAMSCGKPVIASNILSMPHIIEDRVNGFLVDSEDLDGFTRRIVELIEDTEYGKRIGENARATIIQDFHPQKIALEIETICKRVMGYVS